MAKQPKFSFDRLAAELLASGDATSSKVDYMLSHIVSVASTIVRPSDQSAAFLLSNVAENLVLRGFPRTRLSYSPTAPDGVERLVVRLSGFQVRLSLRLIGGSREISCAYLTGSVKLPQILSVATAIEFVNRLDREAPSWVVDWERILFMGWQNARAMEKASNGIEAYIAESAHQHGLDYTVNMLTNYAEISVALVGKIKMTAKVPHTKYEKAIDNLFTHAQSVKDTLVKLPEDVLITA